MKKLEQNQKYEVLRYEATLELLDSEGRHAVYVRKQRVRFLRDGVTALEDYGWGTGIAFATHEVYPGRVARRRLEGSRLRGTIELSRTYRAGEELEFSVERLIKNGFESPSEWWLEAELYHATRAILLRVSLPAARPVRESRVARPGLPDSKGIVTEVLKDGRQVLTYREDHPPVGARYTFLWDW
jgi:hypothetical protein